MNINGHLNLLNVFIINNIKGNYIENIMNSFSERIGKKDLKSIIQHDDIDDDLRNALWNAVNIFYFDQVKKNFLPSSSNSRSINIFLRIIWADYFKLRIDEQPQNFSEIKSFIKNYFFNTEWYEVYDFVEFLPRTYKGNYSKSINADYITFCNLKLEKELSGYRFINGQIAGISSPQSVKAIENAINLTDSFKPVNAHLKRALELFSDRQKPDYRNSIKESISAVESYCAILTNNTKTTLGQALKIIEKDHKIHEALKKSFSNLYGYTSNADGIRHALLEEEKLRQEDAQFMLVSCSAFIDYLFQKQSKKIE